MALKQEGKFRFQFGSKGVMDGQFSAPDGITTSPKTDHIYVSDYSNNRIQVFDEKGNFVRTFGTFGDGDGQLNGPRGIFVDEKENVFVADYSNHRIQVFFHLDKRGFEISVF
jgi:DNA-binding beta-propeller fold protein YncE